MLFDPKSGAAARQGKLIFIGAFVVWLTVVATIVCVAAHFITKFW